uniref:Uncharacterized protein n=1 Tax=Sphaerodactylus townsendi TaxID=933632 RepID=A0ACB8FG13_9SAUR
MLTWATVGHPGQPRQLLSNRAKHPLVEKMLARNLTDVWLHRFDTVLRTLNRTLHHPEPCAQEGIFNKEEDEKNAYMYILFVMILFAVTVGSLILGYTRSQKEVDKQSDPYHDYIKERVSMI